MSEKAIKKNVRIGTGVHLKDVLDRAGANPGAIQVHFGGLDKPVMPDTPKFLKSLTIDHARDGEVAVADVADERPRSIMVRAM
jgi:DMSO/TMAO reductase YedYZ molybdopterin-dependent catalytic subunit